jgi:hypothetical protein
VIGFAATVVTLILQLWSEYRRIRRDGSQWSTKSKDLHIDEAQQPGLE